MWNNTLPIAVIGAGFSGTMTALHLLRRLPDLPLLLCERSSVFARGAAYSTDHPVHLLNVRSANMSAYPDQPDHFACWLEEQIAAGPDEIARHVQDTVVGTFVSRCLYGRYLTSLVRESIREDDGALRLRLIPDEVVDLEPTCQGYLLTLAGGRKHAVAGAVLAVGNLLADQTRNGPYIDNPWGSALAEGLQPGRPVVIIGTGLTMVDVTMQLWSSGFAGPVIAISRRGLLPQPHVMSAPWPVPTLDNEQQHSLSRLVRHIRQDVAAARKQGIAWQNVVDSLRPMTSRIWQRLPEVEQTRFLRHARPWWDVHRHRTAPPVAQQLRSLIEHNYLSIRAGRITSVETAAGLATVTYRPRGGGEVATLDAQRVVNATGAVPAGDVQSPLLRRLLDRGLVRLDRHHLGLDVTDRLETFRASGMVSPRLWALGPVVRGVFWECTAVPDIRRQAVELADRVAEDLHPEAIPVGLVRGG
ncbi:FAD/NAD(P)-binding protein [Microvirga massiliensis]|uniref:FAD/NAD(P)-binding protein n=1 Tax=Microvirga massiliensis TaxID=1033741 RepID=UPI00062BE074|nr:FAD/NAD(P)-binding protein [Microvirga massiliensis]